MLPAASFATERLVYRTFDKEKDLDFFRQLTADPVIMMNSDVAIPMPLTITQLDKIQENFEKSFMFILGCLKVPHPTKAGAYQAGEPIGWVVADQHGGPRMSHHQIYHFGMQLHEDYRNKGYGTELLQWSVDHLFRHANAHRIQAAFFSWNEPARKLYRRVGFVEEGVGRKAFWQNGEWHDEIAIGMLQEDWQASQASKKDPGATKV